jgi:peptidoglycan hydrolase-like protein with peptidoglycan-binding domain
MSRPTPLTRRALELLAVVLATVAMVAVLLPSPTATPPAEPSARASTNPVTPGNFRGFGFDQCLTPTQGAMNTWLNHSPFLAVGIYISGDSRACRDQPNLTAKWVSTQLSKGWRLLPITLGPQASCQPRFPRYRDDFKINPKPGANNGYSIAKGQGTTEGGRSVAAAQALGIVAGSTLWYDLEGFTLGDTHCRESALQFLSGWVTQVRSLGYRAGVYSSAGSGIKMLDDARVNRPGKFALPDAIWIARWDGIANTSTTYIREDGWRPGGRVKQYTGGHDETWGGVRINIDSNFLEVGKGSVAAPETRCGGIQIGFLRYVALRAPTESGRTSPADQVKALQCLLKEAGLYAGQLGGTFTPQLLAAAQEWQRRTSFPVQAVWSRKNWATLFAAGTQPVLKFGSAGPDVRRVQRALNALYPRLGLVSTGTFDAPTHNAVRAWQEDAGIPVSGVVNPASWAALARAER